MLPALDLNLDASSRDWMLFHEGTSPFVKVLLSDCVICGVWIAASDSVYLSYFDEPFDVQTTHGSE